MLDDRYKNDGKPLIRLNELQQTMQKQVLDKVQSGLYATEKVDCAVCAGRNFETLAEKDRYGLPTPVVICRDCGLVQTNPRMTQEAYNQFYGTEYRKLYDGTETATEKFFAEQQRRGKRTLRYLVTAGILPREGDGRLVVEVGCGAGGILHSFREAGYTIKGIDLGGAYVEYGKSKHDLDLSVNSLATLSLETAPALIIYCDVMEHILDLNAELQVVSNLLAADGHAYIEVPGVKNMTHSYKMDFLKYLQNAHTYHFTLASLTNIMARNGFELTAGDEFVHSVFKRGETKDQPVNDYAPTMEILRRVERLNEILPRQIKKNKGKLKDVALKGLGIVGL